MSHHPAPAPALRPVVARVAALNLGCFFIEIAVALAIGSVALVMDSLDFLEDAAINLLIVAGLGWSARNRARLGTGMAFLLLLPALAGAWAAYEKFADFVPPAPNDTVANLAVIAAGLTTVAVPSPWPDLIAAALIAILNADSAVDILRAAAAERRAAA
jgi:Co/Zn/Cd efflux system component